MGYGWDCSSKSWKELFEPILKCVKIITKSFFFCFLFNGNGEGRMLGGKQEMGEVAAKKEGTSSCCVPSVHPALSQPALLVKEMTSPWIYICFKDDRKSHFCF